MDGADEGDEQQGERKREVNGIATLEEALAIAAQFEMDGCKEVTVSEGPPFWVIGTVCPQSATDDATIHPKYLNQDRVSKHPRNDHTQQHIAIQVIRRTVTHLV